MIENISQFIMSLIHDVHAMILKPIFYYEFFAIALIAMVGFGIAQKLCRYLPGDLPKPGKELQTRKEFLAASRHIVLPITICLLLAAGLEFLHYQQIKTVIFRGFVGITLIWSIWSILQAYVSNHVIRKVSTWILVPYALLELFGWFGPVRQALEQFAIVLGDFRLSAYMLINGALLLIFIFWFGGIASSAGEGYIRGNQSLNRATRELLVKLYDIVLYTTLFLVTLDMVGIDITALAVFSGALGVGLGFGLQKIASNFVSGIILLTERSVNINNLIKLNDGTVGYVRRLGARACVIETFDGKEYLVPNEDLITSRVANLTHTNKRGRIEIPVGVSYDSDLHQVKQLMIEAAKSYELASTDEGYTPKCYLMEYADSSVNFLLTFWLNDVTSGVRSARSDVMFNIWDVFKKHNIEIPYPQHDLHIKTPIKG